MRTIWYKHREILFILALFLAAGLMYTLLIPLFEAPAEGSHFRYVRHIAEGHGLPLVPAGVMFPQEHQAPLYYLLTGALVAPLDLSGPALPRPNPYHVYNNPGPIEDNRNSYYHTPDEAFPYRGQVLAVHLGRLVALVMGALTVLATYAIAGQVLAEDKALPVVSSRRVQPAHQAIAWGAAAVNAFNPQFVFIASVMSNDTTAAAFSGWALFFALRTLRHGLAWRRSVLLGACVGLATIAKLNGLATLPIAWLAISAAGLPLSAGNLGTRGPAHWRGLGRWLKHMLLVSGLATLIAGWWYVRNWVLYRDPFTLKLASERWGTGGVTRSFREIVGQWREIEVGFWGLFGHDNLLMHAWVYDVLHVVAWLALIGLVAWGIRAGWHARQRLQPVWALGLWPRLGLVALSVIAAFFGLYRWLLITDLPAGRYLYPSISAISLLLFLGLAGLSPRRLIPLLAGALGTGLLTLTLVTPFCYIAPAYTLPPLLATDAAVPNRVNISYAEHIQLVGYQIREGVIRPGEWLHVTLYWQPMERVDTDLTVALRVLGRGGAIVGSKDTFPGLGRYPTSLWQPGVVVQDTYPLYIAPDAKTPARLSLDVSLYHQPTMFVLPKFDGSGHEISQLGLGEAKLAAYSTQPPVIAQPAHFTLGDEIRLVGYSPGQLGPASPGDSLNLTLYWQALAAPAADYTVFIHLLDDQNQRVASWDAPPLSGDYPTRLWSAEEMVEDVHRLTVPSDLAPGEYQLFVGLYRLDGLQRLPTFDAHQARLPDDAIPLLTLPITDR